jgi:tetratricopeptide (TPR) repeat protein
MAELELAFGYSPDLKYFEQPQSETKPLSAGWLAVQARLGLRTGNSEQADKAYHSAIRIAQEEIAAQGNMSGVGRVASRQAMVSLLEAALEMNDWAYAQELVRQLSEIAPNEPYTHLAVIRFIVTLGEFQLACKRLNVQQHAPGDAALAQDKKAAMEEAIQQASTLVQMLEKNNPTYDLAYPIINLEHWHARGQIVFYHSDPTHVDQTQLSAAIARLKHHAPSQPQSADEAAAVITGYSLLGNQDEEHNLLAEILQITRPHSRNAWAWFNAALALERQYPREAFGAVRGAIQLLPAKQTALAALNQALLGRIAHQINDLTIAREAIEAALAIWPDEAAWHALAAQIYQASHRPAEGLKHLQQAAKLTPTALSVQLELGKAYLADNNPGNGAISHAILCFDSAVHLNPEDVTAWIWLAQAQLRAKYIEAAAKSVEQILKISPDNIEAAMLRAEIALQKKAYQAAHSFAQSAVQASPQDPKTTLLLAKTLRSLNRPTEALQVLESALPISKDPLELQYERAKLLHELHGPEAALKVLTELVANFPDDANILTSLARSQADLGDLQAATQTAMAALKAGKINLEPGELASIHYLTGTLLRRSGQLDQAIQQLNEAVTLAPDNLEGYLELGLARKERREYQQALQAFEQATRIAPHDPRPHYQAGLALKEGKDYRRSEIMLRQAAHLAPDDVLVRRQLAQVVALNVVHNPRP